MFGSQAAAFIEQPKVGRTAGKTDSENRFKTLEVVGFKREGVLKDISFDLWDGEILGIAGLAGAGRTELMRALMGIDKLDSGSINIFGKIEKIGHPQKAYELGIAMVPEDRKILGILSEFSIEKSVSISKLVNVLKSGWLSAKKEKDLASEFISKFSIKTPNSREKIRNLSGGNQQKVIISRCLNTNPRILIFDEPTRGVDVGAKAAVHNIIRALAQEGVAVLVISSDLPEVMALADRVLVMREGRQAGILDISEATQEKVNLNIVNASISGDTTSGGASRLPTLLKTHQPQLLVIELGGNDALRGLNLGMTEKNLTAMATAGQKSGAKVLIISMQVPPNYGDSYRKQMDATYQQVSKATGAQLNVQFLKGVADDPDPLKWFQADRIHPNEKAQAIMMNNVWPQMKKMLGH
jgi:ABC-type multidrug transport system ATPase subunit